MEPKEPSPTHPNRTEHKQEPPTRSRGRPRLPTEQKEQPPKLGQLGQGQLVAFSRAQDPENVKTFIIPIENKQGPMPSPLNNTYTSNVVYRNVLL